LSGSGTLYDVMLKRANFRFNLGLFYDSKSFGAAAISCPQSFSIS
jgi:hypothetical protein